MHEFALRRGKIADGENADAADARSAQPGDGEADLDVLRESKRREIGAARFDNEADRIAASMSSIPCSTSQAFTALSNHW
jgi:hypothetical protein